MMFACTVVNVVYDLLSLYTPRGGFVRSRDYAAATNQNQVRARELLAIPCASTARWDKLVKSLLNAIITSFYFPQTCPNE